MITPSISCKNRSDDTKEIISFVLVNRAHEYDQNIPRQRGDNNSPATTQFNLM